MDDMLLLGALSSPVPPATAKAGAEEAPAGLFEAILSGLVASQVAYEADAEAAADDEDAELCLELGNLGVPLGSEEIVLTSMPQPPVEAPTIGAEEAAAELTAESAAAPAPYQPTDDGKALHLETSTIVESETVTVEAGAEATTASESAAPDDLQPPAEAQRGEPTPNTVPAAAVESETTAAVAERTGLEAGSGPPAENVESHPGDRSALTPSEETAFTSAEIRVGSGGEEPEIVSLDAEQGESREAVAKPETTQDTRIQFDAPDPSASRPAPPADLATASTDGSVEAQPSPSPEPAPLHVARYEPAPGTPRDMPEDIQVSVIRQAASAIRFGRDGGGIIRLRLHPPELGEMQVRVTVEGNTVRADMRVESVAVREAILANVGQLQRAVAGHQMIVSRVDVTVTGDGRGGADREDSPFERGGHPAESDSDAERERSGNHRRDREDGLHYLA